MNKEDNRELINENKAESIRYFILSSIIIFCWVLSDFNIIEGYLYINNVTIQIEDLFFLAFSLTSLCEYASKYYYLHKRWYLIVSIFFCCSFILGIYFIIVA